MPRPKKAPPPTHQEFVFHVRAPSVSYGFGIEPNRQRREGKATIYPEPAFVDHRLLDGDDVKRKWIGYVRATKGEFETVIWLPPHASRSLGDAMASGLIRSMLTNGPIEPRGMHRATSASFHGPEFDPVAYVG